MKYNQKYKIEDYLYKKFSMLTIVDEIYTTTKTGKLVRKFKCLCDCGKEHSVVVNMILSGRQKSCGCYKKITDKKFKTHGMSKSRPYIIWSGMIARTSNTNDQRWVDYGGRGITVCDDWKSFDNFWKDMQESYSEDLEIDRINVDGNYCIENCRWTSRNVQAHNKRKKSDTKSIYTGVTLDNKTLKWRARIVLEKGIRKHLGMFISELDAARAYDNVSEEIYGDRPNKTFR